MKKLILISLLLPLSHWASAQSSPTDDGPAHNQSISVTTGTQGFGAEYRYGLFSTLNLRGGFSLLPVNANNVFTVNGLNSNNTLSAKFTNVHLLADFTPFSGFQFLRIVAGGAYFLKANGHVSVQPTDSYSYGDIALTQSQVGTLDMDVNWKNIAPYLGLGLVHAFPQRKFNINLDLGTYYLSSPTAQITGTGILVGNSSQSGQLQQNVSGYHWLPTLQLNFNFKL
jgi:hypothetical protein